MKRAYIKPKTEVLEVEFHQMLAESPTPPPTPPTYSEPTKLEFKEWTGGVFGTNDEDYI